MELQDRYRWRATLPDGSIRETGADLTGAAMVSLIPASPLFPQHDVLGLPVLHRFGRGFVRGMGGGMREYVHCIVGESFRLYVRSSDGAVLLAPPDYELYL